MSQTYQMSSSPHVRSPLTTGAVMYDVILALLPATVFGVWHFGVHALLIILMSVVSAVLTEFVFNAVTGKENTLRDGSAVLTGLLLALCLPPQAPLYIPYIGAVFAIAVVKGLFGGLGRNFLNPALAARCFLLLSFGGPMTQYFADGVSGATPLASGSADLLRILTGHAGGVIGCSAIALLLGGLYLLLSGGITWHIPVATIGSFTVFLLLFGKDMTLPRLISQLAGGGVLMAAFFMATDPVTSPVSGPGQLIYGACVGILSGLLRRFGSSADSVSYAVLLSNLAAPVLDEYIVPRPYAFRNREGRPEAPAKTWLPKTAGAVVAVAAVCTALALLVSSLTGGVVEKRRLAENAETYRAVLPGAENFEVPDSAAEGLDAQEGSIRVDEVITAMDAAGNELGTVVSVTNPDGRDAPISLSVGILPDGTLSGIVYTDLNETPGIGMKVADPSFTEQFAGVKADRLTLGENIDAATGATVSSEAVVDAVNAALDFWTTFVRES